MVCGGLRWFVVVCGGLWWIAVVCLLVIPPGNTCHRYDRKVKTEFPWHGGFAVPLVTLEKKKRQC